jgi:hypothetical protein
MARCAGGARTATTTPDADQGPNLYATAASGNLHVREVGAFNTTTTAVAVALVRCTTAGTVGAVVAEENVSDPTHTILGVVSGVHSVAPSIGGPIRTAQLGAAIGSGVIWTFGEAGLIIPEGTANGISIVVPQGTGQHFDFYFEWDE